jgi:hypothetical protein
LPTQLIHCEWLRSLSKHIVDLGSLS